MPTSNTLSVNKKGFTLIELLITMTIIVILSVIGLTTYQGIQSRARDTQRLDDAKKLSIALEQYKSGTGYYPKVGTGAWDIFSPDIDHKSIWISGLDGSNFVGNVLPSDPRNTGRFKYYYRSSSNNSGADYCLQIPQENNVTGHPYYRGRWGPNGGVVDSASPWQLRFGPYGPNSGLCGTLENNSL